MYLDLSCCEIFGSELGRSMLRRKRDYDRRSRNDQVKTVYNRRSSCLFKFIFEPFCMYNFILFSFAILQI